jgi:hypothetical protein
MNEKLKMKPSVFLVISRVVATILVLLIIGMAFFGIFDFRSEEQKIADFKEEILTDSFTQAALRGLRYAFNRTSRDSPESISVFSKSENIYVAVTFKGDDGKSIKYYYNATLGKGIDAKAYGSAINDVLFGIRTYADWECRVLCEEV